MNLLLKYVDPPQLLLKGGPGSGPRIGQTKSGKDVHAETEPEQYSDFSKQDHQDASRIHDDHATTLYSDKKKRRWHYRQADVHNIAAMNKSIYLPAQVSPNLVLNTPKKDMSKSLYLIASTPPQLLLKGFMGSNVGGMGGDDFLLQFQGTEYFNEAAKLCEREIDLRMRNLEQTFPDERDNWGKMDKVHLEKQKLLLQLARDRNTKSKKIDAAMEKANPHRDPSIGTYIGGGAHKAKTHDLSEFMDSLSQTSGEDLKKDKY